jgi:formylglycine-generating enzyme required for sulfatase activity
LSGNVWEWCNDWKDCSKDSLSRINPVGPDSAVSRVQKGGSWRHAPEALRSAGCRGGYAYNTYAYVGFRICRSVIDP